MNEKRKIFRTIKNPPIIRVVSPFQRFIEQEAIGSKILLACILIGIIWSNIPWGKTYDAFWNITLSFGLSNNVDLTQPLIWWINNGLMTIFFFVIGLELKREVLIGGLTDKRDAIFSIITGLSGMIFPVIFFLSLNYPKSEGFHGWSIPIATDIAIAIGVLSLFSYNIPRRIKLILTSMTIIDDVGSILIIAVLHSEAFDWRFFLGAIVIIGLLILINRLGIRNLLFYMILGVLLWFLVLQSGIHATIAGVILAAIIPASKRIDLCDFYDISKKSLNDISEIELTGEDEASCYNRVISQVQALEKGFQNIRAPLDIIEHRIIGFSAFFIVPIFAISNSGINFFEMASNPFTSRLFWGIIMGLVLGKPLGILTSSLILKKVKLFNMPSNTTWYHVVGMAFLMGIGFTMSSFLAGLSFHSNLEMLNISKIAILIGSAISGAIGFIILKISVKKSIESQTDEEEG
ncbi:MAG: Na+/H+ antiporter NhaA [Candidatus Heimdallarchaeota archaeon]|nr:Na+/H+ antiporter NhaA [Candidatus Heimdallarchaeota archaeon]